MARALSELGATRALVAHGEDGLDELTTTARSRLAWADGGRLGELDLDPGSLGIEAPDADSLAGGDAKENAATLEALLDGEHSPRRDIVLLNAAAALWVAGRAVADTLPDALAEGMRLAAESIDSGAARGKLDALVAATRRARNSV